MTLKVMIRHARPTASEIEQFDVLYVMSKGPRFFPESRMLAE